MVKFPYSCCFESLELSLATYFFKAKSESFVGILYREFKTFLRSRTFIVFFSGNSARTLIYYSTTKYSWSNINLNVYFSIIFIITIRKRQNRKKHSKMFPANNIARVNTAWRAIRSLKSPARISSSGNPLQSATNAFRPTNYGHYWLNSWVVILCSVQHSLSAEFFL